MSPWNLRSPNPDAVAHLSSELGVRAVTASCLATRGFEQAVTARAFLAPRLAELRPPAGLAGFEQAVERIAQAIRSGEHIGCFGDYDADGVTTAAVFTSYVRQLGGQVSPRVARRDAGYGFSLEDAEAFAELGCTLIVTGDCGTSDVPSIERAREQGADVVVVDHHTVPAIDPEHPHPAFALVNPFRTDSSFPFTGMASVGLMFYMMVALRTRLTQAGFFGDGQAPDVRELLDLVAVGTVADLVPLVAENRILTRHGLARLASRFDDGVRPGIAELLRSAGIERDEPIDEKTIGWKLAPRLNAPGRLGDAAPALNLLLAADRAEATRWAEVLEQANDDRRREQERVLVEALELLGSDDDGTEPGHAIVVAGHGWAPGVVGIVAAKLVERYQRPSFVIAIDPETGEGRGSARSCGGVNLYEALSSCERLLLRFGGHAGAAGLTVDESRIRELSDALCRAVEAQALPADTDALVADAEVQLGEVDTKLTDELARLAPFGRGNERPLLISRRLRVRESRCVGASGAHLKLQLEDGAGTQRGAIGFGLGELDPGSGSYVDVVFAPMVNTWGGRRRIELEVRDLSPSPAVEISERAESAPSAGPKLRGNGPGGNG